jgi:23S rRNA pseudouridine1911/1915/1917 synthase
MKKKYKKPFRKEADKKSGVVFQVTEKALLMEFLMAQMPGKSRSKIKFLLGKKRVLVEGQPVSQFNYPLTAGQKVEISKESVKANKAPQHFSIVFEDEDLIVIDKQSGLLTISTEKEKRATAYSLLSDHVKEQDPENKIFIVHRLDRETSGLLLFAKSERVKHHLQELWNETVVDRTYLALVEGKIEKKEATVTSYLVEGKTFVVHSTQDSKKGKIAITNYKVFKQNKHYSLLKVNLETGRKNQIRVHMQDLGHSIVGDKKYGATGSPIKRLGLHAQKLSFIHPVNGKKMEFETEIPPVLLKVF